MMSLKEDNTGLSRPALRAVTLSIASDSEGKCAIIGVFSLSIRRMERVVARRADRERPVLQLPVGLFPIQFCH